MENKLVITVEENGSYSIETKLPNVVVIGMLELIKQTEIDRVMHVSLDTEPLAQEIEVEDAEV